MCLYMRRTSEAPLRYNPRDDWHEGLRVFGPADYLKKRYLIVIKMMSKGEPK